MPSKVSPQDIASIREWLAKESYLPQDFNDLMIEKFIHSCYGSLEKTKKCIERFCTIRSAMPETFTSRDPKDTSLQTAFAITTVTTYKAEDVEVLIHQLDDPTLENFNFYNILKSFGIQTDCWLRSHNFLPESHTIILDMNNYHLRMIPKVNIMYFGDFVQYLLEGLPVRLTAIHAVNAPSYYERLYAFVKPVLPIEIRNSITFHTGVEGLYKHIDKKYLPSEFGGEAQSMKEQQKTWVNIVTNEERDWYLDDNRWKADLQKKPKNSMESIMNGSFRTLSID